MDYFRKYISFAITAFVLILMVLAVLFKDEIRISKPFSYAGYPSELTSQQQIRVLVLQYFPQQSGLLKRADNGAILDGLDGRPVSLVRSNTGRLNSVLLNGLQAGTIYRGYKNPSNRPALLFSVARTIIYSADYPKIAMQANDPAKENLAPDYTKILTGSGFNLCRDYVDNAAYNVKEIWIWTYGSNIPSPEWFVSSNDLNTNSLYDLRFDALLPKCGNSYSVLHLNYGRSVAEAIHSHGHLLESIFEFIDTPGVSIFTGRLIGRPLFEKFTGGWDYNARNWKNASAPRRCGAVHAPPNARFDDDYYNSDSAFSDCENWDPNTDGLQNQTQISCKTWSKSSNCNAVDNYDVKHGQAAYLIYWMQNIPGFNNQLIHDDSKIRNWWEFLADFNKAISKSKSLEYYTDLELVEINADKINPMAGEVVTFTATFKNNGSYGSSFNNLRFRLDLDYVSDRGWDNVSSKRTPPLEAGASRTERVAVWTATPGVNRAEVCIDPLNVRVESSERNNCKFLSFVVGDSVLKIYRVRADKTTLMPGADVFVGAAPVSPFLIMHNDNPLVLNISFAEEMMSHIIISSLLENYQIKIGACYYDVGSPECDVLDSSFKGIYEYNEIMAIDRISRWAHTFVVGVNETDDILAPEPGKVVKIVIVYEEPKWELKVVGLYFRSLNIIDSFGVLVYPQFISNFFDSKRMLLSRYGEYILSMADFATAPTTAGRQAIAGTCYTDIVNNDCVVENFSPLVCGFGSCLYTVRIPYSSQILTKVFFQLVPAP